jgi:DNA-binding SARP family transcriptional activator/tetratricopeptide (TPR) repeat protein
VAAETEFCLLGPLLVRRGGVPVPVPPGKQRALLAALLLSAGQVVPVNELVEVLWGSGSPPSARASLQNHVMRLRKSLAGTGDSRIATEPDGYQLTVRAGELDLDRFESSLAAAREAARTASWADAAAALRTGLSLWRGQPLADVPSDALVRREAPRLAELRLQALEARVDADLHLGRHGEVTIELRQLVAAHPLRERLHGLLMIALYRDGQQGSALAAYQAARQVLLDELGTEPGPDLRHLQQQILTADPALAVPVLAEKIGGSAGAGPPPRQHSEPAVPRQLPGAAAYFAGRGAELAALTGMLDQAAQAGGTVVISAIAGTAGIGKTTLAVHWAHQVADRFPDGQLHVNLRGFDPSGTPLTAAEAVRLFLDGLGVAPERIPAGLDAQAALYRSLLADQRMLIVLDNARDPAQVRPLLAGGPGCMVLVTSRNQLTGRAVADGAHLLTLDVLTEAEARDMLACRLSPGRVTAEPAAVTELTALCARLPLALSIAIARAAGRPGLPLATLTAELRGTLARLDALGTGDAATDVRTVFSWSYRQLSGPAAQMFRLLGVHPGADISGPAAASLAGVTAGQARQALAELARTHLITELNAGRYSSHDLLRAYAAELGVSCDSDTSRHAALHRVLDHYLHTADTASRLLAPYRDPITLSPPRPAVRPEEIDSRQQALDWFQAERQVLLAAIGQAAGGGFGAHAWQLPWAVATFLNFHGYWHELASSQESALAAARQLGDLAGQAQAHRHLGQVQIRLGAYSDASSRLSEALELFRQLGNSTAEARTHYDLGHICELRGHSREALSHLEQALRLYRAAGHRSGEANALNAAGWCHAQLGAHQEALDYCAQALALNRELGNRSGEAATLDSLGCAHLHLGHHAEAIACCQQAVDIHRDTDDLHLRAEMLTHLGDAYQAGADRSAARRAWRQALDILDDLHDPGAAQVRSRLRLGSADGHGGPGTSARSMAADGEELSKSS